MTNMWLPSQVRQLAKDNHLFEDHFSLEKTIAGADTLVGRVASFAWSTNSSFAESLPTPRREFIIQVASWAACEILLIG